MKEKLLDKKAAIVIAFKDFKDEEFFITKDILEKAGVVVKVFSNKASVAMGSDGGEAQVDLLVENLRPVDFDTVIFVGGSGCLKNLNNEDSYRIARETIVQNKILAAICIAPVILAKAGVLKGKKATVWSSTFNKKSIEILKENGAIYTTGPAVQDEKIITANGPEAAVEFGQIILSALHKKI